MIYVRTVRTHTVKLLWQQLEGPASASFFFGLSSPRHTTEDGDRVQPCQPNKPRCYPQQLEASALFQWFFRFFGQKHLNDLKRIKCLYH